MSTIDTLASAIARMEGFTAGRGRGVVNNNPGNLRDYRTAAGAWAIWPGLPHDDAGFPRFPSVSDGWAALKRDLGLKSARGMTLQQIIGAWAPASDGNDTAGYLANVSAWTGLRPDQTLDGAAAGPAAPGAVIAWPDLSAASAWLETDTALLSALAVAVIGLGFAVA